MSARGRGSRAGGKGGGSELAPGQYGQRSSTQELLDKRVSSRGPYDLFTGERNKTSKAVVRRGEG